MPGSRPGRSTLKPAPVMSPSITSLRPIRRVAIIGAGSAGITQAKQLVDAFARSEYALELVVFEARSEVGGVWIEDPEPGEFVTRYDASGEAHILSAEPGVLPSPIYAGLRTNLPNDLMTYRASPFPSNTQTYPKALPVLDYLQNYAKQNDVVKYIRFKTTVRRIYKESERDVEMGLPLRSDGRENVNGTSGTSPGKWIIESETRQDGAGTECGGIVAEKFDFVSIANGHYEKVWIPTVPGMQGFTGKILHSKYYRHPEDYRGNHVLVIGSLSSGSDLAREIASLNCAISELPPAMRIPSDAPEEPDKIPGVRTRVVQSSSKGGQGKEWENKDEEGEPWVKFIRQKGLVERFENPSAEERVQGKTSSIVFQDGSRAEGVDAIIYATGYSYYLPFFKMADEPWCDPAVRPLEKEILEVDVVTSRNGNQKNGKAEGGAALGGLQGQGMRNLDELQVFLKQDRSFAFLGLPYMIVPFQLCESQSHLIALLWAGRLPNFPEHPDRPPNPKDQQEVEKESEPVSEERASGDAVALKADIKRSNIPSAMAEAGMTPAKRHTEVVRAGYVYGFPYEFEYQDWLADLCAEAYEDEAEARFWKVPEERWARRGDGSLRKRTLGY